MIYPKIEITEQRHVYIVPGVSREAFQDVGVRMTTEDPNLTYYLHAHGYDPFGGTSCNDRCQLVRRGIVAANFTQMDVANESADT